MSKWLLTIAVQPRAEARFQSAAEMKAALMAVPAMLAPAQTSFASRVQNSAASAGQANQLAVSAATVAQRGGEVVSDRKSVV